MDRRARRFQIRTPVAAKHALHGCACSEGDASVEGYDEDCLYLNVWTPGPNVNAKRPVMFWCHGGGFAQESGTWPWVYGESLSRRGDVVVVTINHRLNLFGYCHLGDIGGEKYAASGNVGMLDLVQGLQWVHDNIASFGGDPGKVMILSASISQPDGAHETASKPTAFFLMKSCAGFCWTKDSVWG